MLSRRPEQCNISRIPCSPYGRITNFQVPKRAVGPWKKRIEKLHLKFKSIVLESSPKRWKKRYSNRCLLETHSSPSTSELNQISCNIQPPRLSNSTLHSNRIDISDRFFPRRVCRTAATPTIRADATLGPRRRGESIQCALQPQQVWSFSPGRKTGFVILLPLLWTEPATALSLSSLPRSPPSISIYPPALVITVHRSELYSISRFVVSPRHANCTSSSGSFGPSPILDFYFFPLFDVLSLRPRTFTRFSCYAEGMWLYIFLTPRYNDFLK